MRKRHFLFASALALLCSSGALHAQDFKLTSSGYFKNQGVDVMAFDDIYPEGHQGGVCIIMNGHRVATNGDIRLEATPGQWQPVPKQLDRKLGDNSITATLCYPDSSRHLTGFNPMIYPDLHLIYTVQVESKGKHIEVTVDLDRPIPQEFIGKVGFNLEFFPGSLFGKPWIMDGQSGIFPQQPNSPLMTTQPNHLHTGNYHNGKKSLADIDKLIGKGYSPIVADDIISEPYAKGRKFTSRPDDPYNKVTIESLSGDLQLFDGRMNHNNGWFVLRSNIKPGVTKGAVKWIITPNIVADWMYQPVIQTSQIGYHPAQDKEAVIEMDVRDSRKETAYIIQKLTKHVNSKRGAELCIAALVSIANFCTANNTIAIITVGPLANDIATRYRVDKRKSASILDTFSCVIQGIIPYGAQMLIAAKLASLSPLSIIEYLYYPVAIGIFALLSIFLRYPRRYS